MNPIATGVVGREAELETIEAFLADRAALPGTLVIDGPAGAGKSTLWQAAVDRAREAGFTVLACRPSGAEMQLSFAALADLLEPHLEAVLPALPGPQRRALEVALLLEDETDGAPDQRTISAGTLNAIRALARERPVLVAIDDAQWLDPRSARSTRRSGSRSTAATPAARPGWAFDFGRSRIGRRDRRPTSCLELLGSGPRSSGDSWRALSAPAGTCSPIGARRAGLPPASPCRRSSR